MFYNKYYNPRIGRNKLNKSYYESFVVDAEGKPFDDPAGVYVTKTKAGNKQDHEEHFIPLQFFGGRIYHLNNPDDVAEATRLEKKGIAVNKDWFEMDGQLWPERDPKYIETPLFKKLSHNVLKSYATHLTIAQFFQDKDDSGEHYHRVNKRDIDHIMCIDRFVIDIDFENHRVMSPELKKQIVCILEDNFPVKIAFFIDSGSGIQCVILFEHRKDIYAIKDAYNAINRRLNELVNEILRDFYIPAHTDILPMNGLHRAPGTYNPRSRSYAKVMMGDLSRRFTLEDIRDAVLPDYTRPIAKPASVLQKSRRKLEKSDEINPKKQSRAWALARGDMYMIAGVLEEGRRNKFLYAAGVNSHLGDADEREKYVRSLNKHLHKPLDEPEIRHLLYEISAAISKNKYIYISFEKQLAWIGITESDLKKWNLKLRMPVNAEERRNHRTISVTIARKSWQNRRDKMRADERDRLRHLKAAAALLAYKTCGTLRKAAGKLQCAVNTLCKYIDYAKKFMAIDPDFLLNVLKGDSDPPKSQCPADVKNQPSDNNLSSSDSGCQTQYIIDDSGPQTDNAINDNECQYFWQEDCDFYAEGHMYVIRTEDDLPDFDDDDCDDYASDMLEIV